MNEPKSVAEVIQITESRFNAIAPDWMKYDAEKGFAIQLIKNNDRLAQAAKSSPQSLQQAITNVAAIGLSLNPAEKLAYLIPRNIKVKDEQGRDQWESRIYLEPSYMGLIRLATDSGSIEWIQAKIVREEDDFCDNGPGEKPTHKYNAFKDRGEVVGVYATAKTKGGDYLTQLMDIGKLHSIRDRSETYKKYKSGTWVTDFEEMAKKAVIRNLFKTLPRTDERRMAMLAQAVHLSNENEGFDPLESSPSYGQPTTDQKNYFDKMIENQDALGMYCFLDSMGEQVALKTSLYHSFPKGEKGKYQRIVDDLTNQGRSQFIDLQNAILDAIRQGDDLYIKETCDELSQEVLDHIKAQLNSDDHFALTEMISE